METIVVTLTKGKETSGTHRFEADKSADTPITTLYVRKTAFAGGKVPDAVRVTVEPID